MVINGCNKQQVLYWCARQSLQCFVEKSCTHLTFMSSNLFIKAIFYWRSALITCLFIRKCTKEVMSTKILLDYIFLFLVQFWFDAFIFVDIFSVKSFSILALYTVHLYCSACSCLCMEIQLPYFVFSLFKNCSLASFLTTVCFKDGDRSTITFPRKGLQAKSQAMFFQYKHEE